VSPRLDYNVVFYFSFSCRLLRLLRKERNVMHSLVSLGLTRGQSIELLTHPDIGASQNDASTVLDGMVDASDRREGGGVIIWWNDIESDERYVWNLFMHTFRI
jgi:UDP-glucose:glycoprotein glucosyltransferase